MKEKVGKVFLLGALLIISCDNPDQQIPVKIEGRLEDEGFKMVTITITDYLTKTVILTDTLRNNRFKKTAFLQPNRFYKVERDLKPVKSDVGIWTLAILYAEEGTKYRFKDEHVDKQPFLIESNSITQKGLNKYESEMAVLSKEHTSKISALERLQIAALDRNDIKLVDSLTSVLAVHQYQFTDKFYSHLNTFLIQQSPGNLIPFLLLRFASQKALWQYSDLYLKLLDKLNDADKGSEYTQKIIAKINLKDKVSLGDKIKNLYGTDPEGKKFDFSTVNKASITYLDFWASWCAPCRMMNPQLKQYYQRYHNKGFEVVGISLDDNKSAWINAIKHDGLPWPNYSDLSNQDRNSKQFNIYDIPQNLVINSKGTVIGKNLGLDSLKRLLNRL